MRLKLYTLLIICTSLFMGTSLMSCSDSPSKKKPVKKAMKKGASAKKMLSQAEFWKIAKKNVGLNDKQIKGIKDLNNKYRKKVSTLKKAKKWDGKVNTKVRKATQTAKVNELKKLLGNKYSKWQMFLTRNGIKQPAKKGVKKGVKKPAKKKPVSKKAGNNKKKKNNKKPAKKKK